jgi:hypothetical protein
MVICVQLTYRLDVSVISMGRTVNRGKVMRTG